MAEPMSPSPRAARRVLLALAFAAGKASSRRSSTGRTVDGSKLRWRVAAAMLATSVCALTGCGNAIYAFKANSAANKVEEAHELGAEKLAPYEYFYAKLHLDKAEEEAAEADYSDAINLAEASEDYADKAIRLTKAAQRGAGR
jgi:anti-sigma-K factor RskA